MNAKAAAPLIEQVNVTVEAISKFGVKSAEGTWYNWKRGDKTIGAGSFERGASYVLGIEDGKYPAIVSVVSAPQSNIPESPKQATNGHSHTQDVPAMSGLAAASKKRIAYGREVTAYEYEKDLAIRVSGVVQAVVGSSSVASLALKEDDLTAITERVSRKVLGICGTLTEELKAKNPF